MTKNLKRYYQVWELRQKGKKLQEIAQLMGFKSRELARRMIAYIDFKIKYNKPKSKKLLSLIQKYKIGV
jgi:transcriptional regulator